MIRSIDIIYVLLNLQLCTFWETFGMNNRYAEDGNGWQC